MRGKGKYHGKHHAAGGITPAYAGKSFPARIAHPDFRDHPRLCGEKTVSTCPRLADTGSPPPMRGKVPHLTLAGSSGWDHPRLCGEKGAIK